MLNNNIDNFKYFKDYKQEIKDNIGELKVIYSDLDGTLFNDQGCVIMDVDGNYYFDAVRLLEGIRKKDWDLVLVSGRNKYQLRFNAQMIGIKNYISELGTELIYNLGKEIHVTFDHKKMGFDLTYGSQDLKKIIELVMGKFPGKIESRMEWSRYRSYIALFLGELDTDEVNRFLKEKRGN